MMPAVHAIASYLGYPLQLEFALPAEIVFWGIVVILGDQPIYMLYLGRRYWPALAFECGERLERKRLDRLKSLAAQRPSKASVSSKQYERLRRAWTEANIELQSFPPSEDVAGAENGERVVRLPTRLGNLVLAYESYPVARYGLDGEFYWRRIWLKLETGLRSEIDQAQAIADCTIYLSFVSALAAVIAFVYLALIAGIDLIGMHPTIQYLPSVTGLSVFIPCFALFSYVIYRLGIFAHEQYGETFKAVFDQFHGELGFIDEVSQYVIQKGGQQVPDIVETRRMAWRFLRWYLIRIPGTENNVPPGKVARLSNRVKYDR